jgi:hypothetical protein
MFLNWSCVVSSFQKLEGQLMREVEIGVRLLNARRLRMWTQGRLAKEAG